MIYLENERLRVEFTEPGELNNRGFRFDRAGYVSEVVLDGHYRFLAEEPKYLFHPITGGRGLCCEYTADYSVEVQDGELFPKLGVGLMERDGDYIFYGKYKGLQQFPVNISREEEELVFITEPLPCLGIAAGVTKRFRLEDNTLIMECAFENVGEREIVTEEYCHNFLCVDGMSISPAYDLQLPVKETVEKRILDNVFEGESNIMLTKEGLSFLRQSQEVSMSLIDEENLSFGETFDWTLWNKLAKAGVQGSDRINYRHLTVWTVDHMISPEIFQEIRVRPGETYTWSRSWTFKGEL